MPARARCRPERRAEAGRPEVDRVAQRGLEVLDVEPASERHVVAHLPGNRGIDVDRLQDGIDCLVSPYPVGGVFRLQAERRIDAESRLQVSGKVGREIEVRNPVQADWIAAGSAGDQNAGPAGDVVP
jgi:hypothetical protein